MICHGNGFTSWLLFREKQAYHVWGPLPLSTSSQLAETKVDGGYVNMDGSGSAVLELKDFPTSMVSSRKYDNFYYISSPIDPVMEIAGFEMFNWDVENQTLWEANFANNQTVEIANSSDGQFPGGVTASPENGYLVYPLTQKMDSNQDQAMGFLPNNLNPFAADSSLIAANLSSGSESTSLSGSYNRQLFHSFADFSADGSAFFTITRQGQGFDFVKIALESGKATSFSEVFPGFDWNSVNWDEFFPRENDFAYAKFTLSPDQKRLVAYKNIYATNPDNPCATDGLHHLWVFNLENNALESFQNQPGFVSDSSWKPDSAQIALAIMENSGCYPDYLEARIEVFDKDAKNSTILVTESKSKITNIGWSPDGSVIAYDTYTTDYVGRLKMVDVTSRQVNEVINTHSLGYDTSQTNPITLLFANWVSIP
jgi:hypothetical protein